MKRTTVTLLLAVIALAFGAGVQAQPAGKGPGAKGPEKMDCAKAADKDLCEKRNKAIEECMAKPAGPDRAKCMQDNMPHKGAGKAAAKS